MSDVWNDGEFHRLYVSTRLESGSATVDVEWVNCCAYRI